MEPSLLCNQSFAFLSYAKDGGLDSTPSPRWVPQPSPFKAAGLDFSPAISRSSRLPPLPADQFNFNPAVQGMRNADQRSYCQIPRLVLHRRDLWRAHFRLRRQFCLAEILRGPQLGDLHSQLQILELALDQPSQLLIRHLFLLETLPSCRHFFLPSIRRTCSSIRASAMRISPSGNCALRFTIPCRSTNTLLASPK